MPPYMHALIVTCGALGCVAAHRDSPGARVDVLMEEAPKFAADELRSASGAGDCFNAAFLMTRLCGGSPLASLRAGRHAAHLALRSVRAVPKELNFKDVIAPQLECSYG